MLHMRFRQRRPHAERGNQICWLLDTMADGNSISTVVSLYPTGSAL